MQTGNQITPLKAKGKILQPYYTEKLKTLLTVSNFV